MTDDQAARQRWMGVLARAKASEIEARLASVAPLPPHTRLRGPELGSVMVQGRAGGAGAAFHLGEMTVVRCNGAEQRRLLRARLCGGPGRPASRVGGGARRSAAGSDTPHRDRGGRGDPRLPASRRNGGRRSRRTRRPPGCSSSPWRICGHEPDRRVCRPGRRLAGLLSRAIGRDGAAGGRAQRGCGIAAHRRRSAQRRPRCCSRSSTRRVRSGLGTGCTRRGIGWRSIAALVQRSWVRRRSPARYRCRS